MKGYLTVNKMSKLTGIAPSALRYYAKIGLFTPDHVDPETGYKYYALNQVSYAPMIRYLRYLNMPIEEIKRLQGDVSIETTLDALKTQQSIIKYQIHDLNRMYKNLSGRIEEIEKAVSTEHGKLFYEKLPDQYALYVDRPIDVKAPLTDTVVNFQQIIEKQTSHSYEEMFFGRVLSVYSTKDAIEGKFDTYCSTELILDDPLGIKNIRILPAGTYAMMYVNDIRENARQYIPYFLEIIKEDGIQIDGNIRVAYSVGYAVSLKKQEQTTRISVKIK